MIDVRHVRKQLGRRFRHTVGSRRNPGPVRAQYHSLAAAVAVAAQQRPEPIQPPPPIFDLLLAIFFAWGGWKVWQKGRTWRSGALVLWLLALGGFYTFSRSF